ncbi:Uncharacterized protein YukJ [Agromyces sp. CF514]|uniref:DUF2278 family protein n=1 Tax=Agromyces sp. CF514 TaxID=1881031 RepID=UPI0008E0E536|nr:DUF2278 family protein [Agromyces sp. CF514]SFR67620.1 Uncharacterized protein YukJ [Agromyces sp. CF514]
MSLNSYGLLKGRAVAKRREERSGSSPHYQIHLVDDAGTDYRIAVNVLSKLAPSELLFIADEDFRHPLLDALPNASGWTPLPSTPGGVSLDFIRGNLFDRADMRLLPPSADGPDNDLADVFDHYVDRAIATPSVQVYAFGERWGPEQGKPDKIFGFSPGNGVHDIHMNQGNSGTFTGDDGVFQDGGILFHFVDDGRWVAVFLAFQSQAWHTDDATGHTLVGGTQGAPAGSGSTGSGAPSPATSPATSPVGEGDHRVRIVGALVNPVGPAPEAETVTLINTTPASIELAGWQLADQQKHRGPVPGGTLAPGATISFGMPTGVQLGNRGGILTLLDEHGLKVDGVAYTADEARNEGWTVVF